MTLDAVIAFLILGIGSGALISGVGLGVVLSYRGSGLINLSTGAFAMLAGYGFWAMNTGEWGVTIPTFLACVLVMIGVLLLGLLFEYLLVRPLRRATPLAKLVASLGVLTAAQAAMALAFGPEPRPQPSFLPSNNLAILGYSVEANRFWILGIIAVFAIVFVMLYRYTKFGLGTRAASESEANATLFGLSPNSYSLINTLLMAFTMGIVGLIASAVQEVDGTTLPLLVVPALAAALFGRLTSFSTTMIAGVVIGMFESLLTYFSVQGWFPTTEGPGNPLPGTSDLLVFVILVIAMFLRASKIPGRGDIIDRRLPPAPRPKAPLKGAIKWTIPAAIAMFVLPYAYREGLITSVISAVFLLSLVVIAGYVGQLSVVQLCLGGVAGFLVSHFLTDWGISLFPWAALAGVLLAVVVGVACGFPALRTRGVQLVVVTLAAANMIVNFIFSNPAWGAGNIGSPVPVPTLFGLNFGSNASLHGLDGGEPSPLFGWFALIVLVACSLFVCNLRRSALGQEMLAVRANERAAAAAGINIRNIKLIGFGIASGLAGIGGVLLAYSYGTIDSNSYSIALALSLIAFGYIVGITTVPGAIQGSIGIPGGLIPIALYEWFGLQGNWVQFAGGLLLVLAIIKKPDGVALEIFYGPEKPPWRERRIQRIFFGRGTPAPAGTIGSSDATSIESTAGVTS